MSYSFTEKKRIRKDFGKRETVLETPYLLATQIKSYSEYLQFDQSRKVHAEYQRRAGTISDDELRKMLAKHLNQRGLHAALSSVFSIASYSGYAELQYLYYYIGKAPFDVKECKLRGLSYGAPLRVVVRLVIFDKES